jgi:hypothetical protein
MSDPTGPRDAGDSDEPDTRPEDGTGDTWDEDTVDTGVGHSSEHEWAMGESEWEEPEPEYEEPNRGRALPAFLVGALAGVVALGLVWATTVVITGTDDDTGRLAASTVTNTVTSTATAGAEPDHHSDAPTGPSRMHRCRQADEELAGLLRAAGPALDQWEIHIGAMNKLVVGAITLAQATAFWNQTRVGAHQHLDDFYAATREIPFPGADCPSPDAVAQASPELRSCARRVALEREELEADQVAMQTWRGHVRHMEMLRMGQMSAATATRLWLASWRQGVRELGATQSAKRAVARSDAC